MSIATLKKKTFNNNPRIAPLSGNNSLGFSLNGIRPVSGMVGPTNLALSNKSYKNIPCCAGSSETYKTNINTIRISVKNTKGMLSSKWSRCDTLNCENNKNIVQPIDTAIIKHHTQGQYILEKQAQCHLQKVIDLSCADTCHITNSQSNKNHNYSKPNKVGPYTKRAPGAISQKEYINNNLLKSKAFLFGTCKKHFPMYINNNGCNTYYKTYDEAKRAGAI